MKIKSFTVKNIKSFKEKVSLDFGDINVFIGKNASGKSNIINSIKSLLQTRSHQQAYIPPFDGNFIYDSHANCFLEFEPNDISSMGRSSRASSNVLARRNLFANAL